MRSGSARVPRGVAVAVAAAACAGLVAACGGGAGTPAEPTTVSAAGAAAIAPTRTQDYLPGLAADVYEPAGGTGSATGALQPGGNSSAASSSAAPSEPAGAGRGAVVVLVPGGGWLSADRSGLAPLAASLAASGLTVVSVTYRTAATETYYPGPLEDVLCAVAFAGSLPTVTGAGARPVVVVGHSAGANLAALAALTPDRSAAACPYPAVAPDALVGLSGPYDVDQLPEVAVALFGASAQDAPQAWQDGNPLRQAGRRPQVPVLLLHGDADPLVPVSFTTDFAAALEAGGHAVTVDVVPGTDHSGIYQVDVAGDRLAAWIHALP